MLVLRLRPGEVVLVGDAVLRIEKSSRGRVKLAIDAPREIAVRRGKIIARRAASWSAGSARPSR